MSFITLPFPNFVADTDANADDVDANFSAITTVVNGGIDNTNISDLARLDGNKLSNETGKQIPEDRLGPNAVSSRVLASSATVDATRAVGTDALKDLCVTNAKIAVGTIDGSKLASGATIGENKLKITLGTAPISAIGLGFDVYTAMPLTLNGTFPKATYDCLGVYVKNLVIGTRTYYLISPNDSGTNWLLNMSIQVIGTPGGDGTVTGTAVAVFIAKT